MLSRLNPNFLKAGSQAAFKRFYFKGYPREPFAPRFNREPKWMSKEEAMTFIKSGDKVFIHGAAATPLTLVDAMTEHAVKHNLKNVTVCHIHTEGDAPYTKPEMEGIFRANCFFVGSNCRQAVAEGRADFVPIFLSEIPFLFQRRVINLDVAMIQVTPPNAHGYCSLGTSVDCVRAALQNAKVIIGQVNECVPRTYGDGQIHISHFRAIVNDTRPLPEHPQKELTEVESRIGKLIGQELVEDGATLQMGIGAIPDAALKALTSHKHLGVHSEMFSDGIIDLIERGVLTNRYKKIQPGKTVAAFCVGSKKLYDFMHENPFILMADVHFTNMVHMIVKNPKVTAINSAIEIDLTGQVVADSIGKRIYSGVGGQMDFLRGAAIANDGKGKPILALSSTTSKGKSKIVPTIKEGGGVTTTRSHVHYVVTEYGIAYLWGKNLRQRAYELIRISHPEHREELEKAAFERLKVMPSP